MTITATPTNRKAWRLDDILVPTAVFVMAIILWELVVLVWKPPVFLLPAPHQIWQAFAGNIVNLFSYGLNTFLEALGGFVVGCSLGLLVAMIVARSQLVSEVI